MQLRIVLSSVLSASLIAGYALASFYTATQAAHTPWAPLLALLPLTLATLLLVRKTLGNMAMVATALLLGYLLQRYLGHLQAHTPLIYYLQHLGIMCCGAIGFGMSLIPPNEALCTRFARYAHNELTPELQRYTRGATIAWTLFFVIMAVISTLLFTSPLPFSVWIAFDTLFTLPLVMLMFAAEYAVRCALLPKVAGQGVTSAYRAYQAYRADHGTGLKK